MATPAPVKVLVAVGWFKDESGKKHVQDEEITLPRETAEDRANLSRLLDYGIVRLKRSGE